jgi:hypothetical protein
VVKEILGFLVIVSKFEGALLLGVVNHKRTIYCSHALLFETFLRECKKVMSRRHIFVMGKTAKVAVIQEK